jgi:tetratricopeptide (TPR) repeat protein
LRVPSDASAATLTSAVARVQGWECERFAFAKHSHAGRETAMTQARPLDPAGSFAACLGAVLRRLRLGRGLSQAALGRLAGYDGSYVGAVERAAVRPSRELVARCDRALDAGGALLGLWPLTDREWTARAGPGPADPPPAAPAADPDEPGRPAPGRWPGDGGLDAADARPVGGGPDPRAAVGRPPAPDPVFEAMELVRRAEASEVGAGTVEGVERAVERLRRAASATPPAALIPAVEAQRRYVGRLLEARLTLTRRRRLLAAAGWLSILLAQLHFDGGDREAAEANRDAAQRLAGQAGQGELAAWAWEALAWWALADGRHRDALELARAGQDLAPPAGAAALQLALDEAQALAALGDHRAAADARRQADLIRAMLPGAGRGAAVASSG